MALRVKICGLRRPEHVRAAVEGGAAYLGFVFFAASPRSVSAETAATLCAEAPAGVARVGLFVDPDDAMLQKTLDLCPLDMIQLHGAETPTRVAETRSRFRLPVMKALPIAGPEDVARIDAYEGVADQILCDAKPKPGAAVPGGAGEAFDWALLAGRRWRKPWLLAGGLRPETVADAAAISGASQVDVSSGVEARRGEKDEGLIRAFLAAAAAAPAAA
ncbi:MAG: phosphoribosylanthranilate isomerase [Pseudomonadota bacterium]